MPRTVKNITLQEASRLYESLRPSRGATILHQQIDFAFLDVIFGQETLVFNEILCFSNFIFFQYFSILKNRNPKIECWLISTNRELCTTPTKVKIDSSKIITFLNVSTHPTMVQNLRLLSTCCSAFGSSWGFACAQLWYRTKLEKYSWQI